MIGLSSATLVGRMRLEPPSYARREIKPVQPRGISDIYQKQSLPQTSVTTNPTQDPQIVSSSARQDNHIARYTKSFAPPSEPRQQTASVLKRQYATKPTAKSHKFSINSSKVLMAMAIVLFMIGISIAGLGLRTNQHVKAQVEQVTKQPTAEAAAAAGTEGMPDEKKPSAAATKAYSVAPDAPRYITISKLGVHSRILQEGQKADGSMNVPGNIYDAGWYSASSKPGDKTNAAMLIGGHVSGPTQPGVFKNISKLVAGDKIEVERGDGKVFTYAVVRNQTYDAGNVDMNSAMRSTDESKPGLNLITCTGKVVGHEYMQRIVVYATQI